MYQFAFKTLTDNGHDIDLHGLLQHSSLPGGAAPLHLHISQQPMTDGNSVFGVNGKDVYMDEFLALGLELPQVCQNSFIVIPALDTYLKYAVALYLHRTKGEQHA